MPYPGHCLVTGANRGLGLEFVRQLLARGERVVATCRQPGRASALNALAGEHPGRLRVLPLDVAEPRTHVELVAEWPLLAEECDEPPRIGLLVNNAGVLHPGERFGGIGLDNLLHSFRTNAAGPLLVTQALASLLADGARVVNMSSRLGSVAETGRFGTPSYAISKAALNMATAQLTHALADRGIVVVAVSPGWVRTDMGGDKAEVTPENSVAGMLRQVDQLDIQDSGRFLDSQGQVVSW
jgi:NAD(P)-dependent dehydrogenase (short-subunit alcohol dehydrogenase family)